MIKRKLELQAIKDVLIELTAKDYMPSDMTQLDMNKIWILAKAKLKSNPEYRKLNALEDLKHYIAEPCTLEVLQKLEEASSETMADEVVVMWEPLQNKYIVDELLSLINY